ncbi:hypothetical protein P4233_12820 [Pseudomonas aeruginosa]|nr:hypothetical protein [Pseudomonas aeruginosa]
MIDRHHPLAAAYLHGRLLAILRRGAAPAPAAAGTAGTDPRRMALAAIHPCANRTKSSPSAPSSPRNCSAARSIACLGERFDELAAYPWARRPIVAWNSTAIPRRRWRPGPPKRWRPMPARDWTPRPGPARRRTRRSCAPGDAHRPAAWRALQGANG